MPPSSYHLKRRMDIVGAKVISYNRLPIPLLYSYILVDNAVKWLNLIMKTAEIVNKFCSFTVKVYQ